MFFLFKFNAVGKRIEREFLQSLIDKGNCTECGAIWFEMRSASLIWSHKYDFRPKFHKMKFSYHFTTSILKFQNSVAQMQDF